MTVSVGFGKKDILIIMKILVNVIKMLIVFFVNSILIFW